MEVIIFIGLVAIGLVVFYSWSKKDVPADVVKTDQDEAPYKVDTPVVAAADVAPQPVAVEGAGAVEAKPARTARKPAAKKTAAKKTAGAKKPAGKKKSA